MIGTNRFSLSADRGGDPESRHRPCVFVSYRHDEPDQSMARGAAKFLMDMGLDIFFDENDACLREAEAKSSDRAVALCIERGLDSSTALLGTVSRVTFESPWIPYETGGARGRKRYLTHVPEDYRQLFQFPEGSLSIAHLINEHADRVPGFVRLGIPLLDRRELEAWARALHSLHRRGLPSSRSPERPFVTEQEIVGLPRQRDGGVSFK